LKARVQPVLPHGWFLMEQLHGPSYYYDEKSGAKQFDKPTAPRQAPRRHMRPVPDYVDETDYDFQRAHEEYLRRKYPYEHWAGNPY